MEYKPSKWMIYAAVLALMAVCWLYLSFTAADWFKLDTSRVLSKNEPEKQVDVDAVRLAREAELQPVPALAEDDFVLGSRQAKVLLTVYYDFDCPFSARYHQVVKQAMAKYGGDLGVVIRHFPLPSHQWAKPAAAAFECAGRQGKVLAAADQLFAWQTAAQLNQTNIDDLGALLSLDEAAYAACLREPALEQKISSQQRAAEAAGVIGTPHSFLAGLSLAGALPAEDFTDASSQQRQGLFSQIDKALKNR